MLYALNAKCQISTATEVPKATYAHSIANIAEIGRNTGNVIV